MIFGKKGISPMIAAVLLVVIVVVLGAAVMSLVRSYISDGEDQVVIGKESIKCGRDVSISFVIVDDNYQVCMQNNTDDASLNFIIENTGSIDVLDAQLRIVGNKGVFQNDSVLDSKLPPGGTRIVNVTFYPDDTGNIRNVKIVPRINLPGITEHAFCADSGIDISSVPLNCTSYQ